MNVVNQEGKQRPLGDRLRHDIKDGWIDTLGDGIYCVYRDGQSMVITREDAALILSIDTGDPQSTH